MDGHIKTFASRSLCYKLYITYVIQGHTYFGATDQPATVWTKDIPDTSMVIFSGSKLKTVLMILMGYMTTRPSSNPSPHHPVPISDLANPSSG